MRLRRRFVGGPLDGRKLRAPGAPRIYVAFGGTGFYCDYVLRRDRVLQSAAYVFNGFVGKPPFEPRNPGAGIPTIEGLL